jgi:hypothetical protein
MTVYRVRQALRYPTGAGLARVRAAGGLSRLTPEERASLPMVVKEPGDVASDVPEESAGWLLEQGLIEVLDAQATPTVAKRLTHG